MLTVTKLARCCGLSRSTILYYESLGLLRPAFRTGANYREYSEPEVARLRQICAYRDAGLKLADIRVLMESESKNAAKNSGRQNQAAAILKRRLLDLDREVAVLREHQQAIARLLSTRVAKWRTEMMTKDKWVSILRSAGFSDDDMHRWHRVFEQTAPDDHQEFLEYLHISADEIKRIRDWSTKP